MGDADELARFCEVLFVWNQEAEFVIRSAFETSNFDEFEKVSIAADEVVILGEIALAYCVGNFIKHSFISAQCSVSLKRVERCLHECIDFSCYPDVGLRFQVRARGCLGAAHYKQ